MGKRVHVVSKHEEYGSAEGFNWKYEEFHDFLDTLNCDVECGDDDSSEFECGAKNYKEALDLLREYKEKGVTPNFIEKVLTEFYTIDDFEKDLEELGGIDVVLPLMERFYEQRDKDSWWISFVAW